MIDTTCFRVHQHAATEKKGGSKRRRHGTFPRLHYEQAPCARRRRRRPVQLRLAAGRLPGCRLVEVVTTDAREGQFLLADRDYDTNALQTNVERKAWANIPPRFNCKGNFVFSCWISRRRGRVERFFNRIKQFRELPRTTKGASTWIPRQRDHESSAVALSSQSHDCGLRTRKRKLGALWASEVWPLAEEA